MNKIIIYILIMILPFSIFSQETGSFQDKPESITNKILNEEPETPLRRAEVVFFISFPFTVIMSFVFINGVYIIANPSFTFNMIDLPPEILPLSIFSGIFASGVITYNDYLAEEKRKKENLSEISDHSEFKYGVSFQGKF